MRFFRDNRHQGIFLFGFYAGLPAALAISTLQAWFAHAGLSLALSGTVTLLALPYALRFLWTPLFDILRLPWLDPRRSWLMVLQTGLVFSSAAMACLSPAILLPGTHLPLLLVPGLCISFLAASMEILVNAWQKESFSTKELGLATGLYMVGWRIGTLVSGGLALVIAAYWSWHASCWIMTGILATAPFITLLVPSAPACSLSHANFLTMIPGALRDFWARLGSRQMILVFLLVLTYRLGDAMAVALNTSFLLQVAGFSLQTLGLVNKTVSLTAVLLGGLLGGLWLQRLTLSRALFVFGLLQAFSHAGYILLVLCGKSLSCLILSAFLENFCSGLGTVALLTLILQICHADYAATQIALLSAIAYIPKTLTGPLASTWVSHAGWLHFFAGCILLSLVPLVFVSAVRHVAKSGKMLATVA